MKRIDETLTLRSGITFKNRIIMAPMTNKMSFEDGKITSDEINYYAMRSGEVGAVITAAANVQEIGKTWDGELGVYDDHFIPGLNKLALAIKKNGTKAILQIFHGGRITNSKVLKGERPVAPSEIPSLRDGAEVPRKLSHDEIILVIEDFKKATVRAIKAGFDGVEIHGANTYLVQQFFSPHSNRRHDEWGGSVSKRMTFIKRLVEGITETVKKEKPQGFLVGYRFSPEEIETPGITLDDTFELVSYLKTTNLDYLHISLSHYDKKSILDKYQNKTILQHVYEWIGNSMPLIGVGSITNKNHIQDTLKYADIAAVGRILLIDPHFASKILNDQDSLIRKSITKEEVSDLLLSDFVLERFLEKNWLK